MIATRHDQTRSFFSSIEGLRGWLAVLVMINHIGYASNLRPSTLGYLTSLGGANAVRVFMIISGFVIFHLLIEKPEPYPAYLIRRFMRLFPLFAISCIGGYFANLATVPAHVIGADTPFYVEARDIAGATEQWLEAHVLAHATMLHGIISHEFLPWSEYAFNVPGWSISLEWQFYLVAPLMLLALRSPSVAIPLIIGIIVAHHATQQVWVYHQQSMLLDPIIYFSVGIVSRLIYPWLKNGVRQTTVPLTAIGLAAIFIRGPFVVWGLLYLGLIIHRDISNGFTKLYRLLLESRLAGYLGSRSYSVYLCHYPIMLSYSALWASWTNQIGTLTMMAFAVIPSTLIVAEVLYRGIELPAIRLGGHLARMFSPTRMTLTKSVAS
ncbi:acyltransferase [Bradyrhizobium sp. RP6]|uniref:acyltransferase family protein n=1 Tax=Bradyrhizobium sp. RP6 TaxID=2489596 RepID=UPI000F5325F7|nr:acyltransferase [Bradyrhizobium sp. RP6]RQH16492.1 acyltransferase [Bradyrhizobium sp. RP6]